MTHYASADLRFVFHEEYMEKGPHPLRPVVVIDPEDREAVERLMRVVRDKTFRAGDTYPGMGMFADAAQAALREFANPKPAREWRDGDVVQHKSDHYTAQRIKGGEWRTTSQTAGFAAWGDDNFVTSLVAAGTLTVLREQAAD